MVAIDSIRAASAAIAAGLPTTPMLEIEPGIHLKLESLQPTGSYKVRGFLARGLAMPDEGRSRGLLTVSAGNAAQACAWVAHRLGLACRVVVFDSAPAAKVEGIRRWGATADLRGRPEILDWMAAEGWQHDPETFIHPFADPIVMAGHGSLALEVLAQVPDVRRVVLPVGGGGLMGGVGSALRQLRPEVEIVGVQSSGYASMTASLAQGSPATLQPATIADGTAAPVLPQQLDLMTQVVDRWVTVPESELQSAMGRLALRGRIVAEGAGVLAFAALAQLEPGPVTVAVVSGGNVDPSVLSSALTLVRSD